MDEYDLIERRIPYTQNRAPNKYYFNIIHYAQQIDQTIPDIKFEHGQKLIEKKIAEVKAKTGKTPVLVLDNLRSLSNYRENESDDWRPIGIWLKTLRALDVVSIVIDHHGKGENSGPRGSSSKTDWANVSIFIKSVEKGRTQGKIRLGIHFDKARGLRPDDTEDYECEYDFDGKWELVQSAQQQSDEDILSKIYDVRRKDQSTCNAEIDKLEKDLDKGRITKKIFNKLKKAVLKDNNTTQLEIANMCGVSVGKINALMKAQYENYFIRRVNEDYEKAKKGVGGFVSENCIQEFDDLVRKWDQERDKKYPKGSKEGLKLFTNAQLAEKFGMTVNNVEKVNNVLKKQLDLEYPAQTYEGYEKIARERDVKRKGYIRTTSDAAKEQKIKRAIKTVDKTALANDVDIAHRASLKANTNIGGKYLVSSLGIDPKVVNQSIINPIEQKLGTLYENQKNLIKNLKPGKVPKDIQKQLEKINIKISELVDRTDGVLQGVLVDEKNLKPRIYGIDYSKVLGFGLIDDKPIKDLTQEDIDLIKLNVGEQIKTAKKPKFKEKLLKTIGTGAKAVGKVFKPLGYAIGTGAAISAKSQADELGIELSPLDYLAAIEMGDPDMAIKTYKMRTDPEFAKQEEAKTLAIPLDEGTYDVMNNQSTFGKYNDQIKNIKLP